MLVCYLSRSIGIRDHIQILSLSYFAYGSNFNQSDNQKRENSAFSLLIGTVRARGNIKVDGANDQEEC